MYSRKKTDAQGVDIPTDWKENFVRALDEVFLDRLPSEDHIFDAYGKIYSDELVIMACLYNSQNLNEIPVSCFISMDTEVEDPSKSKKDFHQMVDLMGLFFEEFFNDEDFAGHEPNWQETTFKNKKYFFKITRENIALTIQANELLEKSEKLH